jgi:hypothetical protein
MNGSVEEEQAENLFTNLKGLVKQNAVISLLVKTQPAH